jgi:adenosylhomocysteine nucleosidase
MRSRLSAFVFVICLHQNGITQTAVATTGRHTHVTAILGALETEVQLLKDQLQYKQDTVIEGIHFYSGALNGKKVVITRSGVGKVNAAIITTLLLEHFKPGQLLFSGIAGGLKPGLRPGDVVIATTIAYHDYGRKLPDSFETWATRNPFDFEYNPMNFTCDSSLLVMAKKAIPHVSLQAVEGHTPPVIFGTIITGDIFLSDGATGVQLRNKTGADAIEMEGAAVAQTCYQQHTPFLIIRSLSDNANHSASLDFSKYGKIAAENSAAIIMEILKLVEE